MQLINIKSVYFVGIGGIGMSALARYFHRIGCNVAGYDRTPTILTDELSQEGINIHFSDDIHEIAPLYKDVDSTLVVYTPAIPKDHKELNFFFDNGFEVKKRSQVLGLLTKAHKGLCVAGTHGKTTISTMVAHLLKQSKVDCSAFLGGVSQNYKTNYLFSKDSDFVVLEADEFDRSFLQLSPYVALISAVDADHLDIYGEDSAVKASFNEFASLVKEGGVLLTKKEIDFKFTIKESLRHLTYSISDSSADFYAKNIKLEDGLYIFDLVTPIEIYKGLKLGIPALVNVENAVGACAVAILSGVKYDEIKSSLSEFKGIRRRFDYRIKTDNLVLIDDYAHHPEEINATIKSVKALYPNKKITAVFQPHLFSRTNDFYKEFAQSLSVVDQLVMLDIYPARELPVEGVNSQMILNEVVIKEKSLSSKAELFNNIMKLDPEVLVMMGAGDIDKEIDLIVKQLKNQGY